MWRAGAVAAVASFALVGGMGVPVASAADTGTKGEITIGGTSLSDLGIDISTLDLSGLDLSSGDIGAALAGLDLSDVDPQKLLALLDNPAVASLVESCRTGALAGGGSAGGGANVDCGSATGTGMAAVLPGRIDLGALADQISVDLGPSMNLLIAKVPMGDQTVFGILSVLAVKPTGLIATGLKILNLGEVDPTAMGEYTTLEQVAAAAALPVKPVSERFCPGGTFLGLCTGGWQQRTVDANLATRTEALKIAGLLNSRTYDYSVPTVLDPRVPLSGFSTIAGKGLAFALAMNGGTARAEAPNALGLALAGADGADAVSKAYANLGLAMALNMNTSKVGLDWFGAPLDFDRIKSMKILDLAAKLNMLPPGMDLTTIMDSVEGITLPDLKEVSCLGVGTSASASGLGECGNYLGLFDYYKDLRAPVDGQSRQTQWGLTDPTSLFLGQGNALRQVLTPGVMELLTAVAGGDLSKAPLSEVTALLANPFVKDAVAALLSEEKRIKVTKDFVRFTQDVRTTADGTSTRYLLTSDYGLRSPLTLDWLGYRLTLFPAVEVNGTVRPNYLGLPTLTRVTDGTGAGLFPRIGLVELDNPFGLGTVPITPFDPIGGLSSWAKSVTVVDDVKLIADALPKVAAALPEAAPTPSAPVPTVGESADAASEPVIATSEPVVRASSPAPSAAALPATPTAVAEAPATGAPSITESSPTASPSEPQADSSATPPAESPAAPEDSSAAPSSAEAADAAETASPAGGSASSDTADRGTTGAADTDATTTDAAA